jgi:hypothetical protein
MATVAQLEAALMKADAAGDETAAREIAAEIKRVRTVKPAPAAGRTRGTGIGPIDATLDTINEMLIGIPTGTYNAAAMVTDPLMRLIVGDKAVNATQAQRQRAVNALSNTFVTQPRPLARLVGESIGPGAAVSRTAKLAAPLLQKIPLAGNTLANVARATASGGIGVKAPTRTAGISLRLAGGGVSGASNAALQGQDVTTGAMLGAGIPIVGSVLKQIAGRAIDLARMPAVKAGKIIRESLGKDVAAAKAAFAQLSPDDQRLAQQVLIDAGVEPSPFFGVGKIITGQIDPDTSRRVLAQQAAEREARMAGISGGATATAQRAGTEIGRREVSAATGPARDATLARANVAGETVPAAEVLANAARQRANEITASGIVPRTRAFESRGQEQIDAAFQNPELFTFGGPIPRTAALVDRAGQVADDAIATQLRLRDTARDMEDIVADLAAEGMTPLRVGPIVRQLRSMAGQPGTRADDLQRGALTGLAAKLEGLANPNGVIDARDLYQIRKTGLNDIVDTLLSGRQPGSGTKERTASLLTSAREMIDNAIEGAGGKGWKDYLVRTRQGFEAVNRQELAGVGAQLAKKKPDEFIALMKGDRPEIVEDVMGTGQYDIAGMALADPIRYKAMLQTANELRNLNRLGELQSLGETVGGSLLTKEQPSYLSRGIRGIVGAKFPAVAYAGQGLNQVQRAVLSPKVKQELATAYASGPNMARAMNQFPTAVRLSEQAQQTNPITRNFLAQLLNQSFNQ